MTEREEQIRKAEAFVASHPEWRWDAKWEAVLHVDDSGTGAILYPGGSWSIAKHGKAVTENRRAKLFSSLAEAISALNVTPSTTEAKP